MRCYLTGPDGKLLRLEQSPAVFWKQLREALILLKKKWKFGKLKNLVVGSKGVWKIPDRRKLARSLRWAAENVRAISDIELAHAMAFQGKAGILIVAGTGSAAFGRDEKNHRARAGGLGPFLGDEGSAFWIGRETLKNPILQKRLPKGLALRLAHAQNPVRETAKLARSIFKWARGNSSAREIREEAAQELAKLAVDLSRRLYFSGSIPVSWHGSLFKDKLFLQDFTKALKNQNPRFQPQKPNFSNRFSFA